MHPEKFLRIGPASALAREQMRRLFHRHCVTWLCTAVRRIKIAIAGAASCYRQTSRGYQTLPRCCLLVSHWVHALFPGLYLSNFIRGGSKFWLLKSTTVLMHRYTGTRPPLRFLIAAGGGQKFSRGVQPPNPSSNTALPISVGSAWPLSANMTSSTKPEVHRTVAKGWPSHDHRHQAWDNLQSFLV